MERKEGSGMPHSGLRGYYGMAEEDLRAWLEIQNVYATRKAGADSKGGECLRSALNEFLLRVSKHHGFPNCLDFGKGIAKSRLVAKAVGETVAKCHGIGTLDDCLLTDHVYIRAVIYA